MTQTTAQPDTLAEAQDKLEGVQALAQAANHAGRRDQLQLRLIRGANAIFQAKQAGTAKADVREAEIRLAALRSELNDLQKAFEVPLYVADVVITVANDAQRWGLDLPPNCYITISIPGIIERTVELRSPEPDVPF